MTYVTTIFRTNGTKYLLDTSPDTQRQAELDARAHLLGNPRTAYARIKCLHSRHLYQEDGRPTPTAPKVVEVWP